MLGHSKISTTQIYAKVIEKKISEDMHVLREKLSSERKIKKQAHEWFKFLIWMAGNSQGIAVHLLMIWRMRVAQKSDLNIDKNWNKYNVVSGGSSNLD